MEATLIMNNTLLFDMLAYSKDIDTTEKKELMIVQGRKEKYTLIYFVYCENKKIGTILFPTFILGAIKAFNYKLTFVENQKESFYEGRRLVELKLVFSEKYRNLPPPILMRSPIKRINYVISEIP